MEKEEIIKEMGKEASAYYRVGLNCSECVLKAWLDRNETEYSPEVIALASPFGAGIGKSRNTCGALIGACLAVATVKGRKNPLSKETMAERVEELNGENGLYQLFGSMVKDFEDKIGTAVCGEVLSKFDDPEGIERKRFCKGIIEYAGELAGEYIYKE